MRVPTLPVVVAVAIILSTPPVPVGAQWCCQFFGAPGSCQFPADPVDCQSGDGSVVPDAVCNAATGECGVLQAAGSCCEAFGLCLAGPPLNPVNCQLLGDPNFTFFPHAACSPAGSCVTEFCGDGVLQTGLGEQCDDGNNQDGDGCSADCQLEPPVIPILPQAGLFLFAGLLLGTSCWMIRRTFRTQA